MNLRRVVFVTAAAALIAAPARAQPVAPAPSNPLSASFVGGLSTGRGEVGLDVGGTFSFDITGRFGMEARVLHMDRGSGETGLEVSGVMLVTLARTSRAAPYVAIGGGLYRADFDLGDPRFFGRMNGFMDAGTPFVAVETLRGYMEQGYRGGMRFAGVQMPAFYTSRLGQMMVPFDGQWGERSFTDPALSLGGGLTLNLTERLYLRPDVRGLIVFSRGDELVLMSMNAAFGVRF
jgi:hypothetical protein